MSKLLKMVLPLPVSINALYINQATYNPNSKKWVPTGKRILSKEGEKVKKDIITQAKLQMAKDEYQWDYEFTKDNFIYMDTVIYFNRKGRDDNNIYKLLNDSLEKIVYDNDSRVLVRTQRILYDKNNPRVEITFHPVDYIGVFDTLEDYKIFHAKCQGCKRFKRNCSILKNATEAVVQEEIVKLADVFVCSKYNPIKE